MSRLMVTAPLSEDELHKLADRQIIEWSVENQRWEFTDKAMEYIKKKLSTDLATSVMRSDQDDIV